MPWKETCTMQERRLFVDGCISGDYSFAQLCRRFGISRKTGYKWIDRFRAGGDPGLEDRSRARLTQAHRIADSVVERILTLKHQHPDWGPVTIGSKLFRDNPEPDWPATSTIGEILKRHGLVKARRKRYKTPPHTAPLAHATSPNQVWSADFKGQFRLGNAQWCYPLTMSDNSSRMLLCCQGLPGPQLRPSQRVYKRVFREYGLPLRIRTDNGFPFASRCLGGLTALSIWLLRLGVLPERIEPGCPQQNPRHERMHRTLKAKTASPPKGNQSAQQRAFNQFQREYNEERPHQALGKGICPVDVHKPSPRVFPEHLPEMHYPSGHSVRKVKQEGHIKLNGRAYYIANQLAGDHVGLELIEDKCWLLYFGQLKLGIIDERLKCVIRPK